MGRCPVPRGEDDGELHGQGLPVHLPDTGDGPGQIAAQDVDGQRIPQIDPESLGQIRGQGNERRAGIALLPPCAPQQGAAGRKILAVRQSPVPAHGPGHVLADRGVFHRGLSDAYDASPDHGPQIQAGYARGTQNQRAEILNLIGPDIHEKKVGASWDSSAEIVLERLALTMTTPTRAVSPKPRARRD